MICLVPIVFIANIILAPYFWLDKKFGMNTAAAIYIIAIIAFIAFIFIGAYLGY